MISARRLSELFSFDLEAGIVVWVKPPKNHPRMIGKEAGSIRPSRRGKQYCVIKIGRKAYKRGHLIYFMHHGQWPRPCLDHKNGDSLDDRATNLRRATVMQNSWNHKGRKRSINLPMGVRINPTSGRFGARITFKGTHMHLGAYDSPEQASAVYRAKRQELFGVWA